MAQPLAASFCEYTLIIRCPIGVTGREDVSMFIKLLRGLRAVSAHDCVVHVSANGSIRADMDIWGNSYSVLYNKEGFITFKNQHDNTILRLNKREIEDIYQCIAIIVNFLIHYFGCVV